MLLVRVFHNYLCSTLFHYILLQSFILRHIKNGPGIDYLLLKWFCLLRSDVPSAIPCDVPSHVPGIIHSWLPNSFPINMPPATPTDIASVVPSMIPLDLPSKHMDLLELAVK